MGETTKGTSSRTRRRHTHTQANTLAHAHTRTHLMEFMRVVDTVIKGEGDAVLGGLGEDVRLLVIKTHLCL